MKSLSERRDRAAALLVERAERTPHQQLKKLDAEGWTAKKERARLQKQIEEKS